MRLLLDEHYSPAIARQLRERGHDVIALVERPELVAMADDRLLEIMALEGRALLTENAVDFLPLAHQAALEGRSHAGILFSSARRMPRSAGTIGLFVRALDAFLAEHPEDDACHDQLHWLSPR